MGFNSVFKGLPIFPEVAGIFVITTSRLVVHPTLSLILHIQGVTKPMQLANHSPVLVSRLTVHGQTPQMPHTFQGVVFQFHPFLPYILITTTAGYQL